MYYVVCIMWLLCFFFFKQKTAYEMRISDWSSDVCSSDLLFTTVALAQGGTYTSAIMLLSDRYPPGRRGAAIGYLKIGRASCRERGVSTCRSRWSPYH